MMRIGIDFDNTIVGYDAVFHRLAVDRGLVTAETPVVKEAVRNAIRALPGGELHWQDLQATVYGPGMKAAVVMEGVKTFLVFCVERRIPVAVISHKTRFAARDASVDLHRSAVRWLNESGLLDTATTGLDAGSVYFEPTRREKIDRIRSLGCTHFVDDLPEVLTDPEFPPSVNRIHLAVGSADKPAAVVAGGAPIVTARSWSQIQHYFDVRSMTRTI